MVNWNPYLEAICNDYAQWWQAYTITDVEGKLPPQTHLMNLMVGMIEADREAREERLEKKECLTVLEGLRKYANAHVLLVGKPGSGKSTALVRLLLEEAEKENSNYEDSNSPLSKGGRGGSNFHPKIPVLVELRYYKTSILDLIKAFLQRHDPTLTLDKETIITGLRQGQFLLLMDGINELSSEAARRDLQQFRQDYQKTTPMIFTTRILGVGGDLNIPHKLEMLPLSEAQMQQFVCAYLPETGKTMLKQLGSRLKEFGETPLLLWMLCSVFDSNQNRIPANLGSVFQLFTRTYDEKLKQDVPDPNQSKKFWSDLLQHLAFEMTQGSNLKEANVAISRREAERILREFLQENFSNASLERTRYWLDDLLCHHLIQLKGEDQIEFRHQLIQEYYTAEKLLQQLPNLSDEDLQWKYLNYIKWTEPLALMLGLLDDQSQALRVVRLALAIDLKLGSRLAGEVKSQWQEQTVNLVNRLEIPLLFKVLLLDETQSDVAVLILIKALEEPNNNIRSRAADALGNIGSETAIDALIKALKDPDFSVHYGAAIALEKIGSTTAIDALIKVLEDPNNYVHSRAINALGNIGSERAIDALIKALEDPNNYVRCFVTDALGKIGSETAVPALIKALEYPNNDVRYSAINALGKIGSEPAIDALTKALEDSDYCVRHFGADTLRKIGSEQAIDALIKALEYSNNDVRYSATDALGNIGSERAIPNLIKALKNPDCYVRICTAYALGNIGSATTIPALSKALKDPNNDVRRCAADALGKIGLETAIPALIKVLKDPDCCVRICAADALGKIGSDQAIPALIKVLEYSKNDVLYSAIDALGKIGSDQAIPALIKALEYSKNDVCIRTIDALEKIGSVTAIPALIKALKDPNNDVRIRAIDTLEKIGSDQAIPALIKVLKDPDCYVCIRAAAALRRIGSETAIDALIKALEDLNNSVRMCFASELGNIGSDRAIPALSKALKDPNNSVRYSAAEALGRISSETAINALIKALEDSDYSVRNTAAIVLEKIDSATAINALIKALEDPDSGVHSRAADALGKIGSDQAIPALIKALENETFVIANNGFTLDYALQALETLQKSCQYYRPQQLTSQANNIPTTFSTHLMNILHLSDLHFGTFDNATLWSNQLAEDLKHDIKLPHLDALIISGDIANYSTPEEYEAAKQFLDNLRQDFPLNPEQIIIVPGNHDLNWKHAKKAYQLFDREEYQGQLKEGYYIKESDNVIRVRDEEKYQQRFEHFSNFYKTIKGKPYPLEYEQQYTLDHFPNQNLLILGLNSAWQLDHHYKSRASINSNALSNALAEIRRHPDYQNCFKIAVWHHPIHSSFEDRITDSAFLQQLAVAGFRFFLHGHIHKAETSIYRYDVNQYGRNMTQICAGTFGASSKDLISAYPWQYNLLQFKRNELKVYTRRREEENGAWKPDARWTLGAGKSAVDYYTIEL